MSCREGVAGNVEGELGEGVLAQLHRHMRTVIDFLSSSSLLPSLLPLPPAHSSSPPSSPSLLLIPRSLPSLLPLTPAHSSFPPLPPPPPSPLQQGPTWVLLNLAGLYQDIVGNPRQAIECHRCAIHMCPRIYHDVGFMGLSNTLR